MAKAGCTTLERDPTVKALPESDQHTLCVEYTGLVRREDHQANMVSRIETMVKKDGWFNLLVYYNQNFEGWEPEGADSSMQSIIEYGKNARRIAFVNPDPKSIFRYKMSTPLLGGEMRYFNKEDFSEAVAWAKGGAG